MTKRTILITGASTGFGRLLASGRARAGHEPIASMRNVSRANAEPARALASEGVLVVDIDVASDELVERGVAATMSRAGRGDSSTIRATASWHLSRP